MKPEHINNVWDKLITLWHLKDVDLFFQDPKKQLALPAPAPPPDPKMVEVQGKLQLQKQKQDTDAAQKQQQLTTLMQTVSGLNVTELKLDVTELKLDRLIDEMRQLRLQMFGCNRRL